MKDNFSHSNFFRDKFNVLMLVKTGLSSRSRSARYRKRKRYIHFIVLPN